MTASSVRPVMISTAAHGRRVRARNRSSSGQVAMTTVAAQIRPPRKGSSVQKLPTSNMAMTNTSSTRRVTSPAGFIGCSRLWLRMRWIDAHQLGDQDGEEQRPDDAFEDGRHLRAARQRHDVTEADGGQRREAEVQQLDQLQ